MSFPGFGFWPRDYAEFLANFTADIHEYTASHSLFCELIKSIYTNQHAQVNPLLNDTETMCPPFWDDISCFPATDAGEQSVIPCPEYILGTPYDTSGRIFLNYYFISSNINKTKGTLVHKAAYGLMILIFS